MWNKSEIKTYTEWLLGPRLQVDILLLLVLAKPTYVNHDKWRDRSGLLVKPDHTQQNVCRISETLRGTLTPREGGRDGQSKLLRPLLKRHAQ